MQLARRKAESPDLQVAIAEQPTLPANPGLEAMFCDLYRRIHDRAMDHAERFLSASDAEDAVADAALEIWKRWTKLSPEQRTDAYFYGTVHHKVIDRMRLTAAERSVQDAEAVLANLAIGEIDNPTRHTTAADIIDLVVSQMPEERRQVFLLVREHAFTYKEVAEILGVSESTVNTQMTRANADLRAAFKNSDVRVGPGSLPLLKAETQERPND